MVLDTSAFLSGFDPLSVNDDQFTVPNVEQEIRTNTITWIRFRTAVENGKIQIRPPGEKFWNKIKTSANKVGDTFFLSETDLQLLALALELKELGFDPLVITDDYSIQNVATQVEIQFASLVTYGIRRLLTWIRYCPACRKEYDADYSATKCTVCDTDLKRKPLKSRRT